MADDPWADFRRPAAPAGAAAPADDPWAAFRKPAAAAPVPAQAAPAPVPAPDDGSNQAGNTVITAAPVIDEESGGIPVTAPGQTPVITAAPTVQGSVDPRVNAAIDAGIRGIANSATLGLGDRIAAGAEAATGIGGTRGDYAGNLAREQAATEVAHAEHPVASIAGDLVGGAVVPLGAIAAAPKDASLAVRAAMGAGVGAGLGGVQGATSAKDLTNVADVADKAAKGAGIGAAIGGALPVAGAGIGAVYRAVADRLGNNAANPSVGKPATEQLLKAIEADGPDAVKAKLAELADQGMLADAGPSLTAKAQGASASPEARSVIANELTARNEGVNGRIQAAVNDQLGPAESPVALEQTLKDAKGVVAGQHLQAAEQAPAPVGPAIDELAARPVVAKSLRDASDIAANEGKPISSVVLDDAGNVVPNDAAEQFADGSRDRLSGALAKLLGHGSALKEADQILATRAAELAPLYEAARSAEINYDTPEGQKLLELLPRVLPEAKSEAAKIMQLEGSAPGGRWVGGPEPVEASATGLGPAPKQPAPVSLGRYIARNGGINLDGGDAAQLGLDSWHIPLNGKVARPDGRSIDSFWREHLIEKGYLPPDPDGGMSRDVRDEVLNALAEERAGRPTFPLNSAAPTRGTDPAQAAHEAELLSGAKADILRSALQKGVDPREINPEALELAAYGHVANGGSDPYAAYEEALASARAPAGGEAGAAPGRQFQPNVSTWDYYKRGLDRVISGDRDTLTGKVGSLGRAAQGLKTEILDSLDTAVPQFREARQVYSDQSSMLDALNRGREAIRKGRSGEEIRRDLSDLTDAEADVYRLGAGHELKGRLAKASDKADLPHVVFGNQAVRDQVAALAPSRQAFGDFKQAIANEGREFTEAQRPDMRAWTNAYKAAVAKVEKLEPGSPEYNAARQAVGDLRQQLSQVPAFAKGIEKSDEYDRLLGALKKGGTVLDGGKGAIRPEDLAHDLASLSGPEVAALRSGSRAEIDRLLGTKANDLVALKQALQGEGGWNTQKLGALFGADKASAVVNTVGREAHMRNTYTEVIGGSRTDRAAAARREMGNAELPADQLARVAGSAKNETGIGLALAPVKYLGGKVVNGVFGVDQEARDKEIAHALTRKGPEAMQMLGDLLGLSDRRAARAVQARKAGDATAIGLGVVAGAGAERERRRSSGR